MTIKLTSEEMRYITLFEGMTGARVHDCVIDESGNRIIFVVKKGDIGIAIGGRGDKIRNARRVIGKGIKVIEYSDDIIEFLKNTFAPAQVKNVNVVEHDGKRVAIMTVEKQDKGIVIGAKGKKIKNAKKLAHRYYGIHDILIA
jgi:N utilization substance protein A